MIIRLKLEKSRSRKSLECYRYSNLLAPFYSDSEGTYIKWTLLRSTDIKLILLGTEPFLFYLLYNTNNLQLNAEIHRCQKCSRIQTVHLWLIKDTREAIVASSA